MSSTDPGEGGVIIIKGGSCEIHFDEGVFKHDPTNQKRRKHKQETMKIRRIAITGDDDFKKDFPEGFTGEIRITCK